MQPDESQEESVDIQDMFVRQAEEETVEWADSVKVYHERKDQDDSIMGITP